MAGGGIKGAAGLKERLAYLEDFPTEVCIVDSIAATILKF